MRQLRLPEPSLSSSRLPRWTRTPAPVRRTSSIPRFIGLCPHHATTRIEDRDRRALRRDSQLAVERRQRDHARRCRPGEASRAVDSERDDGPTDRVREQVAARRRVALADHDRRGRVDVTADETAAGAAKASSSSRPERPLADVAAGEVQPEHALAGDGDGGDRVSGARLLAVRLATELRDAPTREVPDEDPVAVLRRAAVGVRDEGAVELEREHACRGGDRADGRRTARRRQDEQRGQCEQTLHRRKTLQRGC